MENHNWLITGDGNCRSIGNPEIPEPESIYRLYHFLTDLDSVLEMVEDEIERLDQIIPLVRKLLTSSYWLQMEYSEPSPETGWAVKFLYREHQYPLTVQMVSWLPSKHSTIHNHGTWGIVALLDGQEKNRLWTRQPTPETPHKIQLNHEIILNPGDIAAFTSDAIHSIEALGQDPTISFNLYGVTDHSQRYQYDLEQQSAKKF